MRWMLVLIALAGGAYAADDTSATGNVDMSGMKMDGMKMDGMKMNKGTMAADPKHCAEMQAEQKAGKLPATMQPMMAQCRAAQQPLPPATQDR